MQTWLLAAALLAPLTAYAAPNVAVRAAPDGAARVAPNVAARAAPDEAAFAACEDAIAATQAGSRIPAMLMPAISRVESGRSDARGRVRPWPWTINSNGVGTFFATKEDAVAAVQALQAKGETSIDVGCMQVNLHYHPGAFANLDEAFDPGANARYAARFLTALQGELHDWPLATAAYHSRMVGRGEDYSRKVYGLPPVVRTASIMKPAARAWPPPGAQFAAFAPPEAMFGAFARAR